MRTNPESIYAANNDSPIGFGIHKGKKMIDVPADYLLFCYRKGKLPSYIRDYVIHNLEVLEHEVGSNEAMKDDFDSHYYQEDQSIRGF